MFENLTIGHILIVLVIVLLLFGAKRLPEIGQSMGKGIREFKNSFSDMGKNVQSGASEDRTLPREAPPTSTSVATKQEESREPRRLL